MDEKLHNHWVDLIRPLFKDAASVEGRLLGGVVVFRDFEVNVQWIIITNQSLLKKALKIFRIIFPGEMILEYEGKSERWKMRADRKIKKFIKKNLENFDPENVEPLIVKLIVPKEVLYK